LLVALFMEILMSEWNQENSFLLMGY